MAESAKRHEENSNIIKEIRASTDAAIRNQRASIKTLEIQFGQMSKVLQERGIGGLPGSTEPNPRDHVKSISTAKANSSAIRHIESGPYAVSDAQYNNLSFETVLFPSRLHGTMSSIKDMKKEERSCDLHTDTPKFNKKSEFEIGDEFLKILRDNAFNGKDRGDVSDHISKVLEILEWIKIPNVDEDQLRLHVFPISLSGDAKEWWNNQIEGFNTAYHVYGVWRIQLPDLAVRKSTILVKVYFGKKRVLYSYGHSDASTTHFCSRTQNGESSRAKYQGSSSF
ncbi:hypothetical protein Tco_0382637 [Tanacetum coccineum]